MDGGSLGLCLHRFGGAGESRSSSASWDVRGEGGGHRPKTEERGSMTTLGMLPVVLDKEPAGAEGLVCRGRSDLGLALSVHGGLGMGAGSERGGVCRGRI